MTSPLRSDRLRARLANQDGLAAGAEVVIIGTLIFVVGLLLVINAWNQVDANMAVTAAAREGARAFIQADPGTEQGAAQAAADDALQAMGRQTPANLSISGALVRCARVDVTATMQVDTIRIPFIANTWGAPRQVSATQSEVVDPYRAGLPGTASCN